MGKGEGRYSGCSRALPRTFRRIGAVQDLQAKDACLTSRTDKWLPTISSRGSGSMSQPPSLVCICARHPQALPQTVSSNLCHLQVIILAVHQPGCAQANQYCTWLGAPTQLCSGWPTPHENAWHCPVSRMPKPRIHCSRVRPPQATT